MTSSFCRPVGFDDDNVDDDDDDNDSNDNNNKNICKKTCDISNNN